MRRGQNAPGDTAVTGDQNVQERLCHPWYRSGFSCARDEVSCRDSQVRSPLRAPDSEGITASRISPVRATRMRLAPGAILAPRRRGR